MRKHRKSRRQRKRQKKIIMFGMIGLICMLSVGYAAFSSEFLISGKGTIVEKTVTTNDLKSLVVSQGDGLYTDPVEPGRYVYRGADPDNYIWLDLNGDSATTSNEIYRIVAIEPDGTLKVVAQNSLGKIVFDLGYETIIDGVTNANSTDGTRYSNTSTDYCGYTTSASSYYGCNVWGSNTSMLDSSENSITKMPKSIGETATYTLPNDEAYLNTYLNGAFLNGINSNLQKKIATHIFNVGLLEEDNEQTLEMDLSQESAYKWRGKIALINVTDYVKASTNNTCTSVYAYMNTLDCFNNKDHNYLYHSVLEWLLSPYPRAYSSAVWIIHSESYLDYYNAYFSGREVYPSFYLISNINLKGSGTEEEPYEIAN